MTYAVGYPLWGTHSVTQSVAADFAFNFFYGGIEVGYAGLALTYAVTYLDWTKDDGL